MRANLPCCRSDGGLFSKEQNEDRGEVGDCAGELLMQENSVPDVRMESWRVARRANFEFDIDEGTEL